MGVRPAFDVASSKDESNKHIGKYIADAAKVSVASHGRFSLALSGGSQPEQVKAGLDALTDEKRQSFKLTSGLFSSPTSDQCQTIMRTATISTQSPHLRPLVSRTRRSSRSTPLLEMWQPKRRTTKSAFLLRWVSLQCHQNWISSCSEWARTDTLLLCSPGMRCSKNLLLWWRRSATRPSPPRHASL